jgi:PAS domain S-box-containing protein
MSFVRRTNNATHRDRLRIFALSVLSLLCASATAYALDPNRRISQYGHTAWRVDEGRIPVGSPITQTTDGYIWIGSSEGLLRFDGVRFVPQRMPGQRLPGRGVTALLGASDGSLWIGTTGGLSHLKDGQLKIYTDPAHPSGISAIIEDRSATIWATRYGPAARSEGPLCSVSRETLRCFGTTDGIPVRYGLGLAADRDGQLWFGSTVLCRWKPGAPATTYFDGVSDKLPRGDGVVDVAVSPSGTAWATIDGTGPDLGVRQYSGGTWSSYVAVGFDGSKVRSHTLLFDREGALWVGADNDGIYRIHDGAADHYTASDGLSGNSVSFFHEDREGNMWVRTEGGLDMFHNTSVIGYTAQHGLAGADFRSVLALRDGSVWLASAEAVDVLRQRRGSTSVSDRLLAGHGITAMQEDHSGAVWLGVDHRLLVFQRGRFREISGRDGHPLAGEGWINAIAEDGDHRIWLVTSSGGFFKVEDGKVEERALPDSLRDWRAVVAGRNGLWLAAATGLLSHYVDGRFEAVPLGDSQGPLQIYALFVDADDSVLVSTVRGLYRWSNGQLSALTAENGLPCDVVHSAIMDDHRALWLFAQCGFVRIDAGELAKWRERPHARLIVTFFDALDGAHSGIGASFQPTSVKTPDGRLWFASTSRMHVVDPVGLFQNSVPPPVHVEQITADDTTYDAANGLRLPPRIRDLAIDYTALSLVAPEKVRFRYKLEGYDDAWRDAGNRRQAFYTNLGPRRYRFRVMASNNSGVWNEEGASLQFLIPPAWYQTNGVRALSAVAVIAGLCALYQFRVEHLRRRERQLREAIDTIPAMAWMAERDGTTRYVNRRWVDYTGLSETVTSSTHWRHVIHPEDLDRVERRSAASFAGGDAFEEEARFRGADGEYRWFLNRALPLRDKRRKVLKWYGISTDIEDRKRAEGLQADLAHMNRVSTLGELAASLAHELKQPIAAAITDGQTAVRWLKRDNPDVDEARQATERMVSAGQRASTIIDHLRSLYEKRPPQREPVDANEIIGEMVVMLRGQANRSAVSIGADLALDLPRVKADRVQVQQVLMNLMLNGIEAMLDAGGVLTVTSRPGDGHVVISVSDTGAGLPADAADRIFDAFFTTKPHGSGMGLAISRSIVDSHDGRLWVTSNDGPGASFHFSLPTVR